MEKPSIILAARRDYDDNFNIQIHDVEETKDGSQFPILYAQVSYKDEVKNLELLTEVFSKDKSPYQDLVLKTPYIVIENRVYYIDEFSSLDMEQAKEYIIQSDDETSKLGGILYDA